MITQTPWIERTFNFNYSIGVFPCILERVRGTPARLEELIATLPAILTVRLNDKWSIQEIIGHLATLEELHYGRIEDFLTGKDTLRAADMTNKKTAEANFNNQKVADTLKLFRRNRDEFVTRLESLEDEVLSRTSLHPRLKVQMRLVDMVLFVAEHDDHEIAKITRIAHTLRKSEMS